MELKVSFTGINEFSKQMAGSRQIIGEELVIFVDRQTIAGSAESKRKVGRRTRTLLRSIIHQPARFAGGTARGTWGSNVPYARYHNDGTKPHVIVPVRAKALAWRGGNSRSGMIFARRVNHPGTTGTRFMEAGFDHIKKTLVREKEACARRIAKRLMGGR